MISKARNHRQAELGIEAADEVATRTIACKMMEEVALGGVQAFLEKRPPHWHDWKLNI